jgi:hypothetical protein
MSLFLTDVQNQFFAGYSQGDFFNSHVVLPTLTGAEGTYGYRMQSLDGGRLGYLQLGWLVAH